MPWLEYEVDQDDPEAIAAWEAEIAQQEPVKEGEEPKASLPRPEPQHVTKQVEVQGEARLQVTTESGYQNLAMGPGGVTSVKVIDPPEPEPAATETASTSSKSSSKSSG